MRNHYFSNFTELKTPFGEFIEAQHKLDTHKYALERIENCSSNYVYETYSSIEDSHFVRYFMCWEEEEVVARKVEREKEKEKEEMVIQGSKKKSLNAFLSQKRSDVPEVQKMDSGVGKSKKDFEPKEEKVKVVYVQLEKFEVMRFPKEVLEVKAMMAVVYLLAQAVHVACEVLPAMIPVTTTDDCPRFVKKGSSRNHELSSLFSLAMGDKDVGRWSQKMAEAWTAYRKNKDEERLGELLHHDLEEIGRAEYDIVVEVDGKKVQEKVRVLEPEVLGYSGLKLRLSEFKINFTDLDGSTRKVTLEHLVEDEVVLIGDPSNLLIGYLKTFAAR
jgi:hypothetical protein